ncbi:hypothetical protein NR798_32025 [Archangium gephyra]|uniref:hypothetical protein n=1 Tax=Archangium gephyra TaxID=48 RepID=UPI0035D426CD
MTVRIGNKPAGTSSISNTPSEKPREQQNIPAPKQETVRLFKDDRFVRANNPQLVSLTGESRLSGQPAAAGGFAQGSSLGANGVSANAITGAGGPPQLSPADEQAAGEILGSGDPEQLNTWLAEHPDPAQQAAMMGYIYQANEAMGMMLSKHMSDDAKQNIASALKGAVDAGYISPEQISESAAYTGDGTNYGEIIGLTRDPQLIQTFVDGVMAPTGQGDDGIDPRRAQSAAYALAGMRPQDLGQYLDTHGDQMRDIVSMVNGNGDENTQMALGALLSSAARIPHTGGTVSQGVVELFNAAVPQLGENAASLQGATDFFKRHGDALLKNPAFSDAQTGHLTPGAERTLNEFWARTMFQGVDYEGKDDFNKWTGQWLGRLDRQLAAVPEEENGGVATPDQREDAARFGGIIGTIENGFRNAVELLEKKNEAIEGMVDFVFQAKEFIPSMKFPGASQVTDAGVDAVRNWVVGLLDHDIPTASESLPFHDQFSQAIDNQDLRESYSVGRTEVLVNDGIAGIRD